VTALLSQGSDENACQELAKSTSDEITANVASQQKQLDDMPKGTTECDEVGDHITNAAQTHLTDAFGNQKVAADNLAALLSQKINFGDFEFQQLNKDQCSSFFDQKVFVDAENAVNAAKIQVATANSEVHSAKSAFNDAESEADELVKTCRCNAFKLLGETLETMNQEAFEANTKAWTQSAHMICVLEGTGADSCTVPKLPVVEETEISEQVKNSCFAFKGTLGARNGVPGGEYQFDLVADVCPGGECGENDFRISSRAMCEDMGMLPVCDHPSYCKDDANAWYIGQDHHISHGSHMQNNGYFPSGWNEI